MTPKEKIENLVLARVGKWSEKSVDDLTDEDIDQYEQDAKSEIREGDVETDVPAPYSRHYESKSVAAKTPDGSWVGWTYWFGGGKHGEPESIDWIDDAYDLNCVEEEKMVVARTFSKVAKKDE